ncbi:hypothetical protein ACGF5M_00140 [Gemmatimonadota bacterium]
MITTTTNKNSNSLSSSRPGTASLLRLKHPTAELDMPMNKALGLFPRPSVSLVRIERDDARTESDLWRVFQELLHGHEEIYPDIRRWVRQRVQPGLKTGERRAFVGFCNERPVLTAVVKRGSQSKFCHLRISEDFQGNKLGELMFSLMAQEVRRESKAVHFTLPAGLWEKKKGFFSSFGFKTAKRAEVQYRLFEEELVCSSPFSEVWGSVLGRLPTLLNFFDVAGHERGSGVVLTVKEPHASAIIEGEKSIEIRSRFSPRWVGHRAGICVPGGGGWLIGSALIGDVTVARPEEIWSAFHDQIGCSREEFDAYCSDHEQVFAIQVLDPRPYLAPVPLTQLAHLIGRDMTPPHSYSRITKESGWDDALSVATLLHG